MIINGDALEELKKLPSESVDMCVTSPPYYGLRDYGVDGQIGLEQTPYIYIYIDRGFSGSTQGAQARRNIVAEHRR